tara:strand:- start:447 stop:851 length:405 start_codon:yes stop_codon:yes gene_type:complete
MSALQEIAQLRQRLEELEKQEQEKAKNEMLKSTSLEYNLNNLEIIVEVKACDHVRCDNGMGCNWAKIAGTKWPHEIDDKREREIAEQKIEEVKNHYQKNLTKGYNADLSYLEAILGSLKIMDKRIATLEERINT